MANPLADLMGAAVEQTTGGEKASEDVPEWRDPKSNGSLNLAAIQAPVVVVETTSASEAGAITFDLVSNPLAGLGPLHKEKASAKREPEPPPKEEVFEDENDITLEIGSARGKAAADDDEFDDEFDGAEAAFAQASSLPPPVASAIVPPAAAPLGDAPVSPPRQPEEDRLALQKAAETAAAQAAEAAETAAAEAAARAKEERAASLRQLTAQVSGGEEAVATAPPGDGPVPSAKSAAEKADDVFAASRGNFGAITEDDEEEAAAAEAEAEAQAVEEAEAAFATAAAEPPKPSGAAATNGEQGAGAGTGTEASSGGGGGASSAGPSREERLMMQFEQATAAMDASKAAGSKGAESEEGPSRVARISYLEASRELIAGLSSEALGGIVREEWSSAPWLKRAVPALRPKLKTPEMREHRDKLLGLARTPMDRGPLHERVLNGVYRAITKEDMLPPRYGPRWEPIGFQGDDPATDLRGAGMLGLLSPLHMAMKRPRLLKELYALSKGGADFPLMVVSINFTQVSMQALRAGALTKEANRTKNLDEAFHAFHAACCVHMATQWRTRGLGIADFGPLKKEIEGLAMRKPGKLLAELKRYDAGPVVSSSGKMGGDFVNFG